MYTTKERNVDELWLSQDMSLDIDKKALMELRT